MKSLWKITGLACWLAAFFSCQSPDTGTPVAANAEEGYFSIKQYLANQYELQKDQYYVVLKVVEKDGQTDSTYVDVNKAFFDQLATIFNPSDINDPIYQGKYKVETTNDMGNPYLFLHYTALEGNLLARKVQLTIHDETLKVVSVYIETYKSGLFKTRSSKLHYNAEKSIVIQGYEKTIFSDPSVSVTRYYYSY